MVDILPPGDTPAWAESDPANSIASTWQQEMWPAIWPGLVHRYATRGDRESDLAGLGPTDMGVLSYTHSDQALWVWSGQGWKWLTAVDPDTNPPWTVATLQWLNGGPTELLIGNGTKLSRYQKTGRTVHWNFHIARGTTTNVGTTQYHFTLPFPAANYLLPSGVGLTAATSTEQLVLQLINSTTAVLIRPNGARLSHDSFAWADGHVIRASLTYEAAS